MPIAIDESVATPGALRRRVCDAACLKIAGGGGISGVLAAARTARQAGYEVYLASTLDGPLGIAAALHAAVALNPDRPSGLATLSRFAGRDDPLPAVGGVLAPPDRAGARRWPAALVSQRLDECLALVLVQRPSKPGAPPPHLAACGRYHVQENDRGGHAPPR